jgi:DNA (cytosine-5)-methyltransferase 1
MERAGHKCIGFCEIDKYARQSYKAYFNTEGEWEAHDITRVSDDDVRRIGHTDVICGGFPCQAFSVAGKRGGFNDTRGTLFFEIMRFAHILRPKYLFLENVAGLLNHENGDTFEVILRTLDELGYWYEWQVLNSKDFGVPQNRERVFIIGHLRGQRTRPIFPLAGTAENSCLEVGRVEGIPGHDICKRVYDPSGVSPTVNCVRGGNLEPKIILNVPKYETLVPAENCQTIRGGRTRQAVDGLALSQRTASKT